MKHARVRVHRRGPDDRPVHGVFDTEVSVDDGETWHPVRATAVDVQFRPREIVKVAVTLIGAELDFHIDGLPQ